MVDKIKAWLKAHSVTSQSVASAWFGLTVLYNTNINFKLYCQALYKMIPHGLHSFIVGFLIPIAIFWRSTHTTTVTATVEDGTGQTGSVLGVVTCPDSSNKVE